MNGINLKGFGVRSFMTRGLTAKWGIGENRVPPIWDTNLIGYWDARDLPNGEVSALANKATLATKAPDLTVKGATMADGTLQFDGVDDAAFSAAFAFPEKFTIFWDVDWLGGETSGAGFAHTGDLYVLNHAGNGSLSCCVKLGGSWAYIPSTNVGISTAGKYYSKSGTVANFNGTIGEDATAEKLYIGRSPGGTAFTQMGFRQLLIFNKELSPAEVNEVLTVMFPV